MKKKNRISFQAAIPVLLTLLFLLTSLKPDMLPLVSAFPLKPIGDGLCALSRTGPLGNGLATALWVGIAFLPLFFALRYKKGKDTLAERTVLYLLSATILVALYGMMSPALFRSVLVPGLFDEKFIGEALGMSCWAVLVLFILLRFIRLLSQANKSQLFGYMQTILHVLDLILALVIIYYGVAFVVGISSWIDRGEGYIPVDPTIADKIRSLVWNAIPIVSCILNHALVSKLKKLLAVAGSEGQEGLVPMAQGVSRLCCVTLGVTAAMMAFANILQMILMRWLSNSSFTVDIPLTSLVFTVMILLFTRLLIENKRLREDNNLFI